jgi:hypothetical protein
LPCPASARATTASADSLRRAAARRPFRHEAGSPRVRTLALVARPPNLRGESLVSGASRSLARSPQLAPPHIGFLCVGPRLREELPSDGSLPPRPCSIALGSLRPAFLSPASAHAGRTNCRWSPGIRRVARGRAALARHLRRETAGATQLLASRMTPPPPRGEPRGYRCARPASAGLRSPRNVVVRCSLRPQEPRDGVA